MEFVVAALVLGGTAGVAPGPLLTLVLVSTLERGFGAGLRVSLAPALTDGPIIALALLVLKDLSPVWLAALSLLGGGYLVYVGVSTLRMSRLPLETEVNGEASVRDLGRGMLLNVLNPAPWLFWFTVGGPLLIEAWRDGPLWAILFLAVFYGLIVGTKVLFAWLVSRGRDLLSGAGYRWVLALSGCLLFGLGGVFLWRGVSGLLA